jgi:hypothetical protein
MGTVIFGIGWSASTGDSPSSRRRRRSRSFVPGMRSDACPVREGGYSRATHTALRAVAPSTPRRATDDVQFHTTLHPLARPLVATGQARAAIGPRSSCVPASLRIRKVALTPSREQIIAICAFAGAPNDRNALRAVPTPAEYADRIGPEAITADGRWLVRHAAIRALDNTASTEVEDRLLKHLVETRDPFDQTYCHAVLNRIGTSRSIPAIERNFKSGTRDVKMSAESALRAIRMGHGV